MFKIATWNVNSLRVRLEHVRQWLAAEQPDVLALQETKLPDEAFPRQAIEEAGYQAAFAGQRTYNGVAVLSRRTGTPFADEIPGFRDPQRRVLAVRFGAVDVINLYVPNGSQVGSDKYAYKLEWLRALHAWIAELLQSGRHLLVLGDFNIAPEDRDVHDPLAWEGQVLVSPAERAALGKLIEAGLVDCFRLFEQADGCYSWWDYRARAFRRNHGVRIDLLLADRTLAKQCKTCRIDVGPRKLQQPSDHAPVIGEFALQGTDFALS